MILRLIALTLFLTGLLAACGKHYWEANKRGVAQFQADSGLCIQEAKTKYLCKQSITGAILFNNRLEHHTLGENRRRS